jgi:hypothetical protein
MRPDQRVEAPFTVAPKPLNLRLLRWNLLAFLLRGDSMNKCVVGFAVTIFVLSAPVQKDARAWDATYSGNVSQSLQRLLAQQSDFQAPDQIRIEYPLNEGVAVGQSWDLFLNKKINSTCIDFKSVTEPKYGGARLVFNEATDEETRDVTLNMTFKIAGGGSYEGYSGKGNSSLTDNSFSHYYSKDVLVVAHASAMAESSFAIPADTHPDSPDIDHSLGFKTIHLLPGMATLAKNNGATFRQYCGDGFVATINSGADLYALLTFHVTDQKTRQQIETAVQTSGGYAGFTASGSGSISKLVQTESDAGRLTIEFVQQGGQMKTLPVDLNTLRTKITEFAAEAGAGPRPTYIVIVPYSYLPDFNVSQAGTSTALQAALRYQSRLYSIHTELLDMQADLSQGQPSSNYYFSYIHGMRSEDLQLQRQTIEDELKRVSDLIGALSGCPAGCPADNVNVQAALAQWQSSDANKAMGILNPDQNTGESLFDDLRFWIQLPIPLNAIPADARAIIEGSGATLDQKKEKFATYVYQHWINRQDLARCFLYRECLSQKQQQQYYAQILQTLYADPQQALVVQMSSLGPDRTLLEVSPCVDVQISNARSAIFDNRFSITETDATGHTVKSTLIPDHPGGDNINKPIPFDPSQKRYWLVQSSYIVGGFYQQPRPMVSNSVHYSGSLSTAVWFQDPGSSASVGPNLVVYFQAIPVAAPMCSADLSAMRQVLQMKPPVK